MIRKAMIMPSRAVIGVEMTESSSEFVIESKPRESTYLKLSSVIEWLIPHILTKAPQTTVP